MPTFIRVDSTGAIVGLRRTSNPAVPVPAGYIEVAQDDPELPSLDGSSHFVDNSGVIKRYTPEERIRRMQPPPLKDQQWNGREGRWIDNRPLEARRLEKLQLVNQERERRNLLPIEYAGSLFDADERGQRNVSAWMTNIAAGMALPPGFVWRDFNNVDHPADAAFVVGLGAAITVRGTVLYQAAWTKKAQLDAMTTAEEIAAFDPAQGW